jgi:dihydrofolate reductase
MHANLTTAMNNRMNVALIAAVGKNNELGKNNDLLWRLKSDMEFFKRTTLGHWVIMGRKSWESLPPKYRPLPGRTNAVISRDSAYSAEGSRVFESTEVALLQARIAGAEKVFIIGGGQIYTQALEQELAHEMFLTHVDASFDDADVFFPAIDYSFWNKTLIETFPADDRNEYAGSIWHYRKK